MTAIWAEMAALGAMTLVGLGLGLAWLRRRSQRERVRRVALAHRRARDRLDGEVSGPGQ